MKMKVKQQVERANCKYCKHAEGYENLLAHCTVFNVKRPYGSRKCTEYKK
jgi:hypothetical protein